MVFAKHKLPGANDGDVAEGAEDADDDAALICCALYISTSNLELVQGLVDNIAASGQYDGVKVVDVF